MSDSNKNSNKPSTVRSAQHIKLFIPGPTEVRPEILDAQAQWMFGHRMPECASILIGRIQPKLKEVFYTQSRVLISASSGTGLWEAAVRNTINQKRSTASTAPLATAGAK
jgi:aspartate aminotransferase-like enzyme